MRFIHQEKLAKIHSSIKYAEPWGIGSQNYGSELACLEMTFQFKADTSMHAAGSACECDQLSLLRAWRSGKSAALAPHPLGSNPGSDIF